MNRKGLAILMRTRMIPNNLSISPEEAIRTQPHIGNKQPDGKSNNPSFQKELKVVQESMHSAIALSKTDVVNPILSEFSEDYLSLSTENRRELLVGLSQEYDVNRKQVRELIQQYLVLEPPCGEKSRASFLEEESLSSAFYRTERNLRHALQPKYEVLFDRLNTHPGGLKFLTILRTDILSILAEENVASLRALDSYLKEKLVTWLSPAALELHHITWDDSASLLEKIVAYEAVHPISNLTDLKRRLGLGRRCFGYLHPAIPGEPLIFIEVALLKDVAETIQEVLWDDPPALESEAACALFYSISSTQPGLAGINLGKFLIKRVIELVKRDMPHISTFATLSPIPGFVQWLRSKMASQKKLAEAETEGTLHSPSEDRPVSTFRENILRPEEEKALLDSAVIFLPDQRFWAIRSDLAVVGVVSEEFKHWNLVNRDLTYGNNGVEVMWNLLSSTNCEWTDSERLLSALQAPLMRLCARYLLQEKKRGKALDSVANFHLQNGAMVERLNWMADKSEKGLHQSGGIMVNYVYRLDKIEENAQSYFSGGHIQASYNLQHHLQPQNEE